MQAHNWDLLTHLRGYQNSPTTTKCLLGYVIPFQFNNSDVHTSSDGAVTAADAAHVSESSSSREGGGLFSGWSSGLWWL